MSKEVSIIVDHALKRFIKQDLKSSIKEEALKSCWFTEKEINGWIDDGKLIKEIPFGFIYFLNKRIIQKNNDNIHLKSIKHGSTKKMDMEVTFLILNDYQREWLIQTSKLREVELKKLKKELDYFKTLSPLLKTIIKKFGNTAIESRYFTNENGIRFKCIFQIKNSVYISYIDRGDSSTFIQIILGKLVVYSNKINNIGNFDVIAFISDLIINGVGRIKVFENRMDNINYLENKYPHYFNQIETSFY
ncbi:hypothetical protein [Companilactobacillus zhachilii]|uniref:hypothetical protein n=1 Tax=Companilactobacillus zhachilii TaxID=2304606 RepID=UPI004034CB78